MRVILLLLLTVAGCSSGAPEAPPDSIPQSAAEVGYTDAEQLALLRESIDIVYGSDPQPEWLPTISDLHVEDGWAYVVTGAPDLAEAICASIAAVTFDDDAQPIGVRAVMVFDTAGNDLTDCDVRQP